MGSRGRGEIPILDGSKKNPKGSELFYIAATFALLLSGLIFICYRREFTGDELVTFMNSQEGFFSLLYNGPLYQCSRSPLSYLLFKPLLSFWKTDLLAPANWFKVYIRLPSIIAGIAFLFLVYRLRWISTALSIFVIFAIFQDTFFILLSTEARPYALWLLLSFIFIIQVWNFSKDPSRRKGIFVFLSSLPLTMLAAGSLFIFAGILAWTILVQRKLLGLILFYLFSAILLGVYYASLSSTCVDFATAGNGKHSLITGLHNGDFTLLKQVIKLGISPKSFFDLPMNALFIFSGYLLWKQKERFSEERKLLVFVAIVFSVAFVLTAGALLYRNYYFVPRMFYYLFAARGLLLMLMFRIVSRAWEDKPAYIKYLNIFFVVWIVMALCQMVRFFPVPL